MTECKHNDCFTCPYGDCISEREPISQKSKRGRKPLPPEEKRKRRQAYNKQYYKQHKEHINEKMREYYQEHKDGYRARQKMSREMMGDMGSRTVVVKYAEEFPHLPVAFGDNFHDLGRILGITASAVSHAVHRNSELYKVVEVEPDMYPTNDGRMWYKDPETWETVYVEG